MSNRASGDHVSAMPSRRHLDSVARRATRIVISLLIAFLVLQVSGCDKQNAPNAPATASPSGLQNAIARGELRVGYLVWPPCVTRDQSSGQLGGIYVDMVQHIATSLKLKIDWRETTLANFAAGLESDQFDFSVGPTFVTVPRATSVHFTRPVAYVGNSGVVKTNGKLRPTKIADLNAKGLRIAVLQGQAMEEYCRRYAPEAEVVVLAGGDLTAPLSAVSAGRADIGLMNTVTVLKYTAEHPEVTSVLTGADSVEKLPLAWAVRRGDDETAAFLDASITYLVSTGRLEEFQSKQPVKLLYDAPQLHPMGGP